MCYVQCSRVNVYTLNGRICGTVSHHFEQQPMMIEAFSRVTHINISNIKELCAYIYIAGSFWMALLHFHFFLKFALMIIIGEMITYIYIYIYIVDCMGTFMMSKHFFVRLYSQKSFQVEVLIVYRPSWVYLKLYPCL